MVGFWMAPRPRKGAIGMPASMCAPSSAPIETLSRMFAQEASFEIWLLMPCFAKYPFSCAITSGAQSVSGMMPSVRSVFSSPSPPAAQAPPGTRAVAAFINAAAPISFPPDLSTLRRSMDVGSLPVLSFIADSLLGLRGCMSVGVGQRDPALVAACKTAIAVEACEFQIEREALGQDEVRHHVELAAEIGA